MKVSSKLVKMNFGVGKIERKEQYLIIYSDPDMSTMSTKVRMDAVDLWMMIKAGLNWPVIKYVLALPFLVRRARKEAAAKE